MSAQNDNRRKEIREQVNYYIDDSNMPECGMEKIAYLSCSRQYLAGLVLDGYRFLKAHGLESQYLGWESAHYKPLK